MAMEDLWEVDRMGLGNGDGMGMREKKCRWKKIEELAPIEQGTVKA